MSVAISRANKMQLAKCDIMVGFANPVTYVYPLKKKIPIKLCNIGWSQSAY